MPKVLLNQTMLTRYQDEQHALQEKCARKHVPRLLDRDTHDRTEDGETIRPTGLTARDMRDRDLARLNELNNILSNYEFVEEPKNAHKLCIGSIGTFEPYDSKRGARRLRIGAYGEVDTRTVPPTISYDKVLPFIGQKAGHDAIISEGPMRGDWLLAKIELPKKQQESAATNAA